VGADRDCQESVRKDDDARGTLAAGFDEVGRGTPPADALGLVAGSPSSAFPTGDSNEAGATVGFTSFTRIPFNFGALTTEDVVGAGPDTAAAGRIRTELPMAVSFGIGANDPVASDGIVPLSSVDERQPPSDGFAARGAVDGAVDVRVALG
jgi:hypothetical protein